MTDEKWTTSIDRKDALKEKLVGVTSCIEKLSWDVEYCFREAEVEPDVLQILKTQLAGVAQCNGCAELINIQLKFGSMDDKAMSATVDHLKNVTELALEECQTANGFPYSYTIKPVINKLFSENPKQLDGSIRKTDYKSLDKFIEEFSIQIEKLDEIEQGLKKEMKLDRGNVNNPIAEGRLT